MSALYDEIRYRDTGRLQTVIATLTVLITDSNVTGARQPDYSLAFEPKPHLSIAIACTHGMGSVIRSSKKVVAAARDGLRLRIALADFLGQIATRRLHPTSRSNTLTRPWHAGYRPMASKRRARMPGLLLVYQPC